MARRSLLVHLLLRRGLLVSRLSLIHHLLLLLLLLLLPSAENVGGRLGLCAFGVVLLWLLLPFLRRARGLSRPCR